MFSFPWRFRPAPNPRSGAIGIDVVSDVVCPWCFIGKRRLEKAIALQPDIPVAVRWRPYFLNPWVPREGNRVAYTLHIRPPVAL